MQRICSSLATQGYEVCLVGRKKRTSPAIANAEYVQKRLFCFSEKGFLFYAEYNIRLFFFLLFQPAELVCAIDLDTILPVYLATVLRRKKRVYDAHELFTEQAEVISRPAIHRFWEGLAQRLVPQFPDGYTVNAAIRDELRNRYGVSYNVIRNLPVMTGPDTRNRLHMPVQPFIICQGAVNEGRCFETLIPAMKYVEATLMIYGEGNFSEQARDLIRKYHLEERVLLPGAVPPPRLRQITPSALFGITLFERTGLNQYLSLSNKFFDYIMAGIPQICCDYPEYALINSAHPVALLVEDTSVETLATAMNKLLRDSVLYNTLRANCSSAAQVFNWNAEKEKLLAFYDDIFSGRKPK